MREAAKAVVKFGLGLALFLIGYGLALTVVAWAFRA